jgi:hypothetical protein
VLVAAVLSLAGFAASTATSARAISTIVNTIAGSPAPTCPNGYDFNKAKGTCDPHVDITVTKITATVGGKTVTDHDLASATVTILEWNSAQAGLKRVAPKQQKGCHWTKGGFWNSGKTWNGIPVSYWDPKPGYLCPNLNSPTKWEKRGGGSTNADCKNVASEKKAPFKIITGKVILVRSFANYHVTLHASAIARIDDKANGCYAQASASATANILLRVFVRAKGSVQSNIFASSFAELKTNATAKVNCSTPPPVTTTVSVPTTTTVQTTTTTAQPPSHFTNLTCQGQEEVTGGGSSKLVCSVSNDNGAQISLSVSVLTNKDNLLVSGIQCSSQNGVSACQGNGTFEVRLGGVNETTTPIYSDLEVVARSNGVPSAPFDQKYKIDPRCANFGC